MPRIANIPSELWETASMRAADPEVVYVGRAPQTTNQSVRVSLMFPPVFRGSHSAYVYVLMHCDGTTIYVGKARRPVERLTKHRQREWWDEVYHLLLMRVEGATAREADMLALHVERLCIRHLDPTANVAGVIKRGRPAQGVFVP